MAARCSRSADLDNAYERERQQRISDNQQRLEKMGILKQKTLLESAFRSVRRPTAPCKLPKVKGTPPTRQSQRLQRADPGVQPALHKEGGGQQQRLAVADANAAWLLKRERRCDQKGRGSIYDSTAGITCHFCRQKKLCGEEDCRRCSERDVEQDCIGKSECSRCESACGRFCRACLLVRYSLQLEEVRQQMTAGTWLCPHCYEDDHPDEGWICNSSICMTKRGMKPTGIAIFDAQQQGFASVAHYVQAQLVSKASKKTVNSHTASTDCSLACSSSGASTHSVASGCAADANAAHKGNAQASCNDPESQGAKGSAAQAAAVDMPKDTADRGAIDRAADDTFNLGTSGCKAICSSEAPERPCTSSMAQTDDMKGAMPLQYGAVLADPSRDSLLESESQNVLADGSNAALDQTQQDNKVCEPRIDVKNKDGCQKLNLSHAVVSSSCQTRSRAQQASLTMLQYTVPIRSRRGKA